jgi:hypothetical protein
VPAALDDAAGLQHEDLVRIDDGRESRLIDVPEKEKRAVLPEGIHVGGVVHPDFFVAEEEDEALADVFCQPAPAIATSG